MKKETLKSYLVKSGMAGLPESDKKMENRMVGMGKAHEKIIGRKPNPLDVKAFSESLDKSSRQEHLGKQEGDVGDHNSGRNDSVIYEHKRNK
jgi:hypothetical protein